MAVVVPLETAQRNTGGMFAASYRMGWNGGQSPKGSPACAAMTADQIGQAYAGRGGPAMTVHRDPRHQVSTSGSRPPRPAACTVELILPYGQGNAECYALGRP